MKALPFGGSWLTRLRAGLSSAAVAAKAPLEQMELLYQTGEGMGPGGREEIADLIGDLVDQNLPELDYGVPQKAELYRLIEDLRSGGVLDETMEMSLEGVGKVPEIPKWDTGFMPLDTVLGGVYQGILVVMGAPGLGKTSLMITMMEEIVRSKHCSSVWFFQNEIPGRLMLGRLGQGPTRRTKFRKDDKLFCGPYGPDQVLERCDQDPDPNRVVIFDSPDVVLGNPNQDRRFQLEYAFQRLVALKQKCKLVITSSQPRRNDAAAPRMSSVAESWQKAWYADMILGISRLNTMGDSSRLRLSCLKNRFGRPEGSVVFRYRYNDLSWEMDGDGLEEDEDW